MGLYVDGECKTAVPLQKNLQPQRGDRVLGEGGDGTEPSQRGQYVGAHAI